MVTLRIPHLIPCTMLVSSSMAAGWCGTETPSEALITTFSTIQASSLDRSLSLSYRESQEKINIPVYMHAVVNSSASVDVLNEGILRAQLDAISDRFAPHNIAFSLAGLNRTVDDDLVTGIDSQNWNMFKFRNRKGDYAILNLYYVTDMNPELGGACSTPGNLHPGDIFFYLDGCTMQGYSLPGGHFNGSTYRGEITVHEVGHWLGLLHTFDGESCEGSGDYIDDTPMQAGTIMNACHIGKDTCPDQPGEDPIHNFMDYSGEGRWQEFTPG